MNFIPLALSVVLLNLFSYLTIRLRPIIYKTDLFKPMIWNIKLSLIPFAILIGNLVLFIAISYALTFLGTIPLLILIRNLIFILGLIIWLLVLPNSGYLITELNLTHREVDTVDVPIWYDIVSVLSFALSGILNTIANTVLLQLSFIIMIDPTKLTKMNALLLLASALLINLLVSFGVYLGRSIRFNSWDIIHITSFSKKFITHFKQPGTLKDCGLFVLFHTTLFMIIYVSLAIPFYF